VARVVCKQVNNETEVSHEEVESVPHDSGMTAKQWLDIKAESHQSRGWTITWSPKRRSFHAFKVYDVSSVPEGQYAIYRKDRWFRISG
jgi:hypothetical protein